MFYREKLAEVQDDLMERRAELMERAADIRERFAEDVDNDTMTAFVGWTLVSTGIAYGVTQWMRGRRGGMSLIAPIALLVAGVVALGGGLWRRRGMHIGEVEERIQAELSALGPIARMQVMRDVAGTGFPVGRGSHN